MMSQESINQSDFDAINKFEDENFKLRINYEPRISKSSWHHREHWYLSETHNGYQWSAIVFNNIKEMQAAVDCLQITIAANKYKAGE